MKVIRVLVCKFIFIIFHTTVGQTIIEFESPNQVIDLTKNQIELKLKITNASGAIKDELFLLELTSDLVDQNKLYGITDKKGKDIIITKTDGKEKTILISLNVNEFSQINSFTLFLNDKINNKNLTIRNSTHTIVINKKAVTKSILSFEKPVDRINVDTRADTIIKIPFKIIANGHLPQKNDPIKLFIKIPVLDSLKEFSKYQKEFLITGYESSYVIELKTDKKGQESFEKSLDALVKKELIVIHLDKITYQSSGAIEIDENKNSFNVLVIEEDRKEYNYKNNEQQKYNFYLGTNFDLKQRFETNSFYSEIDVFLPNLINRYGIRAGIYKNNSVSGKKELERDETLVEIVENSITSDSLTIQERRVLNTPSVSYENLGLYVNFLGQLHKDENFELYLSAHLEVIERREEYSYNNVELFPLDVYTISLDSLANDLALQRDLSSNRNRTRKYYSTYYGIGTPALYNNDYIQAFFYPILGLGSPGFYIKDSNNIHLFGSFQFYLKEKRFGIRLSGDVRKYFGFNQDPIIAISLSKSFNLSNIFDSDQ